MVGEAFIVHENGWACSNDVVMDMFTEAVRDPETGRTVAVRKKQTFNILGLFGELVEDQAVDIAFKVDENNTIISFSGRVRQVGKLTIINILGKTDKVKEILSKIV